MPILVAFRGKMEFFVFGEPLAYNNLYRKCNRDKRKKLKDTFIALLKRQHRCLKQFSVNPLKIQFEFYITKKHTIDVDNLIKYYLDIMSGTLYCDDSQVIEIKAEKILAKSYPFTKINIERTKIKEIF